MVDALFFCQFVYLEHVRKSPGRRDFQIPRLIIIWPIGNHGHTILEILEIDGINNVLLAKIGRGRCGTPSASSFTCCFIRGLWQTPLLINQPMGKEHQWMDGICINTLSRLQCSRIGDLICSLKSIFGWSPLAMFVDFPDGNVGVSWMFINFYHVFSFLSWKLPFHQPCQGANLSNFRESKVFFSTPGADHPRSSTREPWCVVIPSHLKAILVPNRSGIFGFMIHFMVIFMIIPATPRKNHPWDPAWNAPVSNAPFNAPKTSMGQEVAGQSYWIITATKLCDKGNGQKRSVLGTVCLWSIIFTSYNLIWYSITWYSLI